MRKAAAVSVTMVILLAGIIAGGCGGGSQTGTAPIGDGLGRVQAKVYFSARAASQTDPGLVATDTVTTESESVIVEISISGNHGEDGVEFVPVTATLNIDISLGYGSVSILNVPIGTNHLLTAVAEWPGGSTETIKCIIPSVQEGISTSATANKESTVIADAAIAYATKYSTTLSAISSTVISLIGDAVDYYYGLGTYYTSMVIDDIVTYVEASIAGCNVAAMQNVTTAKTALFKDTIIADDVAAAETAINSALSVSPNCPDANLLSGIIDLANEAERVSWEVLTEQKSIFPVDAGYSVGESIGRITAPVLNSLPRAADVTTANSLDPDYSNPSEFQAEIAANTLGVLNGALSKLEKVQDAIASDSDWAFTYPKDPAYPSLGNESLDKNDIDILIGVFKLEIGFVYYALAYNLDPPADYATTDPCPEFDYSSYNQGLVLRQADQVFYPPATDTTILALININTCPDADINDDGILTPTEYLPPAPFGTLTTNGAEYLSNAKTYISYGLSYLVDAVDAILAETEATVGGVPVESTLIADVQHYKSYLAKVAASFGGTATSMTKPEEVECWRDNGYGYYYGDNIMDPDYNTDDMEGCTSSNTFTVQPSITVSINLGALFNITNFRNVLPNYILDPDGGKDIASSYIGNTIGGIFPNGLQKSWFDYKEAYFYLSAYNTIDASTGQLLSSVPDSISVTVDGVTIPCEVNASIYYNDVWCQKYVETVPTAADYITINELFGTTVTVSVSGYQDETYIIYDNSVYVSGMELTPVQAP